jgi:hypothetical protein
MVFIAAGWAMDLTYEFSRNSGVALPYIAYCAVLLAGALLGDLLRKSKGKE